VASLSIGTASFGYNLYNGNLFDAGLDAIGIAADAVATVVPILPGGAGVGINAYRAGRMVQKADTVISAGQGVADGIDAGVSASQGDYTGAAINAVGAGLQTAHVGTRVGGMLSGSDEAAETAARLKAGREFDTARNADYPYNQVYIDGADGGRTRLDSYNEDLGEIVSRKHSQLDAVQAETARKYIRELPKKYPVGATISNVPSTRAAGIAGNKLRGDYFLEVPVQRNPVPQSVLDFATRHKVYIRDITGKEY